MATPLPPIPFDDIFIKLGLDHLSAEAKQVMLKDMQEIIENRVTLRILDSLSEQDREAFSKLNTEEEFNEFFSSRKIDPVGIAVEEALKFREELIGDANFIQGQVEASLVADKKAA